MVKFFKKGGIWFFTIQSENDEYGKAGFWGSGTVSAATW